MIVTTLNDVLGGDRVFSVIAWTMVTVVLGIAILHAAGIAHDISREAKLFLWTAMLVIALRIVIRTELDAPRFSWWGNLCWITFVLACCRVFYEHLTGRPGWPHRKQERDHDAAS